MTVLQLQSYLWFQFEKTVIDWKLKFNEFGKSFK